MKRILVIDESEVIRETLALILGREFAVIKRPPASTALSFADINEQIDLLILGLAPQWGAETGRLVKLASGLPFGVLFLVDSRSAARTMVERSQFGCLTKPFNPYDLQEKVGQLLARPAPGGHQVNEGPTGEVFSNYLEYPYLSRSNSVLAQRFAVTHLPILIAGEFGCGQSQVALAMHRSQDSAGLRATIQAPSVTPGSIEDKIFELSMANRTLATSLTLSIENLDGASPDAQALLIELLDQKEEKFPRVRLVSTASSNLLEKVYRGEFIESLYYKVATLTLKLLPLRERREDIPTLAEWFARGYSRHLGLGECTLADGAKSRLKDYLWFGNIGELETVMARTLALHRKSRIEAADLVFDFGADVVAETTSDFTEFIPRAGSTLPRPAPIARENYQQGSQTNGNGHATPDLNVVIHELAHELKNPMVTIKTFAQLLGDRYDDENFRARFQDVVGSDVEKMDDLLEVMIEFADFSQPKADSIALEDKTKVVVRDLAGECAKRQIRFHLTGSEKTCQIYADEAQLGYILKNVLVSVLAQAKMGSDIDVDVEPAGNVSVSYLREGARLSSITHYLSGTGVAAKQNILPLRVLLAKQLVERNGGRLVVNESESDTETMRMEFPMRDHRKES